MSQNAFCNGKSIWTGLHIYYTGGFYSLIKKCVSPLIDNLLNEKKISSYFYILYFDRGFHLRLRVLHDSNLQKTIIETSTESINNFLQLHPSSSNNDRRYFYPNDSIKIVGYEPEVDRYGGDYALVVAERHFRDSSECIFYNIVSNELVTYQDAIKIAIQLHLIFVFQICNGNKPQMIAFLQFVFSLWLGTYKVGQHEETIKLHWRLYNDQSSSINALVNIVLNQITESTLAHPFKRFSAAIKETNEALTSLQKRGLLNNPFEIESEAKWSICQSYMHMTNNRLGISNVDESLVVYYLIQSLHSHG